MALGIPALISATASSTIVYTAPQSPPTVIMVPSSQDAISAIVASTAAKYGIDQTRFHDTLWCESRFQEGQSRYTDSTGPNGREDSWGIPQIHLPDHPTITREQAQDPLFAIDWAGSEFAAGRAWQWSCYKILYSGKM